MPPVTDRIVDHFDCHDPGGVVGVYLYGSSIAGGLRHESDVDLLVVSRRSLSTPERCVITDLLLRYSGRRATVEPGRPVELTSVVHSELTPWSYPPRCDYQYGEWLREEITAGQLPAAHPDPDLAILLIAARSASEPLRGPALDQIIDPAPTADLRRAIRDSLQPLLGYLEGDERNVLLTLARMVVTLETGEIVPKDEAARRVMSGLSQGCREVLNLARRGYLGEAADDWTHLRDQARETADCLASPYSRAVSPRSVRSWLTRAARSVTAATQPDHREGTSVVDGQLPTGGGRVPMAATRHRRRVHRDRRAAGRRHVRGRAAAV